MAESPPQYPILILDASSKRCFVGLKLKADHLDFLASEQEATKSLFSSLKTLLERNHLKLPAIRSIVFCEGPGSMLGIRTTVMAIRTWIGSGIIEGAQLFSFNALALGNLLLQADSELPSHFLIATDARRQAWNVLEIQGGAPQGELIIFENGQLETTTLPVYTFEEFPSWTQTTAPLTSTSYKLEAVFAKDLPLSFLHTTKSPNPLSLRPSEYKKWAPKFSPKVPSDS